MSRWKLSLFCLLALQAAPCFGVIVLKKESTEPIRGFLVSQNDQRIVVDELLPNGETLQRVVQRADIDVLRITVATSRLESLRPDQPQAYRDYADELFEKREDPDARRTALRLYLLTAFLDPQGQGRGALLSMAGLARSPGEERRFRAMVYLLDPAHDRSVLKAPSFTSVSTSDLTESQQTMLLTAIRALRQGNHREALNFARRPLFQETFKRFASTLSIEAFTSAASQRNAVVPDPVTRKLITLELLVLNLPLKDQPSPGDVPWSTILTTKRDAPVTALSLETITEFNPHETVYKTSGWTRPE